MYDPCQKVRLDYRLDPLQLGSTLHQAKYRDLVGQKYFLILECGTVTFQLHREECEPTQSRLSRVSWVLRVVQAVQLASVECVLAHSHHPFPCSFVLLPRRNLTHRVGQVEDQDSTYNEQDWLTDSYASPCGTVECERKIFVLTCCGEVSLGVARRVFVVGVAFAVDHK